MDSSEQKYLDLCKQLIEEKFHFDAGNSSIKQRDFEYLIDLIEEKSGIRLSVSTLKRLWRNGEGQNPHPSTLDALVSLLDYKDWLDFKLRNASSPAAEIPKPPRKTMYYGAVILSGVAIMLLVIISFNRIPGPEFPPAEEILFKANKTVSVGVPNTVIFNYDVSEIAADSFFIQQDWNPNHRDRINPEAEYFSSMFYMPGYHKTKLIANETILKIIPVHVQTDGWMSLALYNYDERPVYLQKDSNQDGVLSANKEDILNSSFDIERFYQTSFINVRAFGDVTGHDFKLDTRLRYREFLNDPCPAMQVTVHTEVHIYYIPLILNGCESNLSIKIGEVFQSARDNDLSAFGTDVYNWQDLTLEVKNKTGTVFLNGNPVHEITFEQDFGKIVGLDYRFSGLGEVDYIRLFSPDNLLVYEDEFEETAQ